MEKQWQNPQDKKSGYQTGHNQPDQNREQINKGQDKKSTEQEQKFGSQTGSRDKPRDTKNLNK